VWTANRLAEVLWRIFGVRSHRDHVSRLLRQMGGRWAADGLEPAAARGPRHPTPRAGKCAVAGGALAGQPKKALEEGYTIVWGDESGFSLLPMLLPMAVRTWAPRGQTPI
jgi:hypothetical protein